MGSPTLIGIGAGLVSAVLFASAAGGTVLSLILFYLAALPGFLAGFGWGLSAAIIASVGGTVFVGLVLGIEAAGAYAATLSLPVIFLTYLIFLRRESGDEGSEGGDAVVEWYPLGRIVLWAAFIAGLIAALVVILLGQNEVSYVEAVQKVLQETVFPEIQANSKTQFSPEQLKSFSNLMVRILPAASAVAWLCLTLLNMWFAMRIAEISGRLERPRPDFSAMSFPPSVGFAFLGALLLSFMGGLPGFLATGFAGALLFVYALLGLAILHAITPQTPWRTMIFFGLYFALFVIGWLWVVLAFFAVGDPFLQLRERFRAGPPSIPRGGD